MRVAPLAIAAWVALPGCVELGVVGDGTTVSLGKPHAGHVVDGVRMPDSGEGFTTREVWRTRGNRWGTDELVDMLAAVSRRLARRWPERLVIGDLGAGGGGPVYAWHRSHQSGRDVDLLIYVRDRSGKPIEADAMRNFDGNGRARDRSGQTVDFARTWALIRELLTAPEAAVQHIFLYEPLSKKLLEHAVAIGEPPALIERARLALRQPGIAPHDDHIHVRIYCSSADRLYGCADAGNTELLALHDADMAAGGGSLAVTTGPKSVIDQTQTLSSTPPPRDPAPPPPKAAATSAAPDLGAIGRMLRTRTDRIVLRRLL